MNISARKKCGGFTLIEIAVVLGVLGALLLVVASLMTGTVDAYARIASKSHLCRRKPISVQQPSQLPAHVFNLTASSARSGKDDAGSFLCSVAIVAFRFRDEVN